MNGAQLRQNSNQSARASRVSWDVAREGGVTLWYAAKSKPPQQGRAGLSRFPIDSAAVLVCAGSACRCATEATMRNLLLREIQSSMLHYAILMDIDIFRNTHAGQNARQPDVSMPGTCPKASFN
eukprot:1109972-Pleurochrysis_carterae.AAC.1